MAIPKAPARALKPHVCRSVESVFVPALMPYPADTESPLESIGVDTFSLCRDVKSIATQPLTVRIDCDDGADQKYTPDVQLGLKDDKEVLIELKPLWWVLKPAVTEKLLALGRHFAAAKKTFHIITDDQLRRSPLQETVHVISRYACDPPPAQALRYLRRTLVAGPKAIDKLLSEGAGKLALVDIYCAIATRAVHLDWTAPLTRTSKVFPPTVREKGLSFGHVLNSGRYADLLRELAMGRKPADQRLCEAREAWRRSVHAPSPYGFLGWVDQRQPRRRHYPGEPATVEAPAGRAAQLRATNQKSDHPEAGG